jgi:tRNA nucleotidyltransferase (CCA-adding enzyme)
MDEKLLEIARAVERAGGRALIVGGYVRDELLGLPSKDVDVEVLGLSREALGEVLADFGRVIPMGRSFAVARVAGLDVDFACSEDPERIGLDFELAAGRRDLTVNSMAIDPLTDELLDPVGGREDLERRRLRATDPARFGDDPLRALRVAQLAARFELEPDAELCRLCAAQDLGGVAGERILEELRKLLLRSARPSRGFAFMRESDQLRLFPELHALIDTPQDLEWHPEGDVWVHTLMSLDRAAELRVDDPDEDLSLMFGVLCHDLGKPETTSEDEGRIRSLGHDRAGIEPTTRLLARLRASNRLIARVCALVEHHLAPALFCKQGAGPKGYRRLARKLESAGVSLELLERVARADHLGRTTEEALARRFPAGDTFLDHARALHVDERGPADVVLGRHLIARGLTPGTEFSAILRRCRALQDELGESDPDRLLDLAFEQVIE